MTVGVLHGPGDLSGLFFPEVTVVLASPHGFARFPAEMRDVAVWQVDGVWSCTSEGAEVRPPWTVELNGRPIIDEVGPVEFEGRWLQLEVDLCSPHDRVARLVVIDAKHLEEIHLPEPVLPLPPFLALAYGADRLDLSLLPEQFLPLLGSEADR